MKQFFKAINNGEYSVVERMIGAAPPLVNCVSNGRPKRDEGQSPLKIAIKNGHYYIVGLLITHGADVNFVPAATCDGHLLPIIHEAVYTAVSMARNPSYTGKIHQNETIEYRLVAPKNKFENALSILKRILESGADLKATDNYGNTCIEVGIRMALRFANNSFCYPERKDLPQAKEWTEDLKAVFTLLIEHGADTNIPDNRMQHDWLITGKNNLLKFVTKKGSQQL